MNARQRRNKFRGPTCPTCGAPTVAAVRPFCSKRCRERDLSRWLDGSYAVPVIEEPGADVSPDEDR